MPRYFGFVDAAGGGGTDSMALCIGYAAAGKAVIAELREATPPFSPDLVCDEFANVLKSVHVSPVWGDRWGGEFVASAFRTRGVPYAKITTKKGVMATKSEMYRVMMPLLASGRVDLLDHPKATKQIAALRSTLQQRGREVIDHPSGAHDDLANVIAGICYLLHRAGLVQLPTPSISGGSTLYVAPERDDIG